MRRLRIGVLDLVTKSPTKALAARILHPSLASIMPQAVGVWCEEAGHDVTFVCYIGFENLLDQLPADMDLLFIGAFSQAAQAAYAVSNMFRQRGCVTVLGGPHARCYPDDARKYFDYVCGFTDRAVIEDILTDCAPHRPYGIHLTAASQPRDLPGVRERWKYIHPTIAKSPTSIKGVPMLGSLGCPYDCHFCIDSVVKYQPLDYDAIREDLRFLVQTMPKAWVGWHDPNFGIRFDDYLSIIEETVPKDTLTFVAESSLAILTEPNVKRMGEAGFKVMVPGIESWYDLGNKSKTGKKTGLDKVRQVADHINMIMRHIPYVQANFVLGMDDGAGEEPFELTKRFIDLAPGTFAAYSLLSAFGEAAPLNVEYQRDGRIRPFPFHFLNNNHAMNVQPKHYEWTEFYDRLIDLTKYTYSWRKIARRWRTNTQRFAKLLNLVRAVSSEGFGRIKYHSNIRRLLDTDRAFRRFFEGESTEIPSFYIERIRKDLGLLWDYLPKGALEHDPNAFLAKAGAPDTPQAAPVH